MENNVSSSQAWTFFADKDLALAEFIAERPEFTGELAFHCQQAVEKYLKAFLAKLKIPFKKTHDLVELYHIVKGVKDLNIDEILLKDIRDLYTEIRYPSSIGLLSDGTLPTQEKAKTYLDFAKNIASIIKNEIYS
jgi:HEPN domain-containing protein